uniref:Uncharacterized protein n=1 Tax=Tanacetum cinerariifolium TaxID=118510 RepID=A0A6L2M4B2_TANCI|nr:hypothetical protein [Tanacetum cinerariifolium]
MDKHVLVNNNIPKVDHNESSIADRFKIKKSVSYPKFDPSLEWNKMEPILVQCGRDVEDGRCTGAYINKKVQKKLFDDADDVVGLSDKRKSKIPNPKPGPKPKSKPGPKPKSKNGKTTKTKTMTFRKPILTRSMKDREGSG